MSKLFWCCWKAFVVANQQVHNLVASYIQGSAIWELSTHKRKGYGIKFSKDVAIKCLLNMNYGFIRLLYILRLSVVKDHVAAELVQPNNQYSFVQIELDSVAH